MRKLSPAKANGWPRSHSSEAEDESLNRQALSASKSHHSLFVSDDANDHHTGSHTLRSWSQGRNQDNTGIALLGHPRLEGRAVAIDGTDPLNLLWVSVLFVTKLTIR